MFNWNEWMQDVYESLHEDPHAGELVGEDESCKRSNYSYDEDDDE